MGLRGVPLSGSLNPGSLKVVPGGVIVRVDNESGAMLGLGVGRDPKVVLGVGGTYWPKAGGVAPAGGDVAEDAPGLT